MKTTDDLGSVLHHDDGRIGLRYRRDLAHPPTKVWRALTESEHMAAWMPCDLVGERRAGASIELRLWPEVVGLGHTDDVVLPGRITVLDEPNVFEWTWGDDVLRWELRETEGGTQLTFTTWFGDPDTPVRMVAAGYHLWLDALLDRLDTGVGTPIAERDPAPLEQRYEGVAG